MKRTHIAAGIILNQDQDQIYITRRAAKAHQGGFWEFPGGKVEKGESAKQAVVRELEEEVGIQATTIYRYLSLNHDYPDKTLTFDFFIVSGFDGEPYGKEGQPGEWVNITGLAEYPFPEANEAVLKKLIGRDFSSIE